MDMQTIFYTLSPLAFTIKPNSGLHESLYPETSSPQWTGASSFILAILITIVAVMTVFGNTLVFIAFVVDASLRTQSNLFLLSLAVCDFSVGAISIPFYVPYALSGIWMLGKGLCKFWLVMDYTACAASVFNIVLISYDRYLSVTKAVAYRAEQEKISMAIAKIALIWLFAFLVYGPAIIFWDFVVNERILPEGQCYAEFDFSWYFIACFMLCNFLMPFCSVTYFNISIYWNIRKRSKIKQVKLKKIKETTSKNAKITKCIFPKKSSIAFIKENPSCVLSVSQESIIFKSPGQNTMDVKGNRCENQNHNKAISTTGNVEKTLSQNVANKLSKDRKIAKSLAVLCWFGVLLVWCLTLGRMDSTKQRPSQILEDSLGDLTALIQELNKCMDRLEQLSLSQVQYTSCFWYTP
ncbi:histamine H3 receptor-like [Protopterus annectens]|uniref:histamine H3 receptor-like n=1 Tax=Protopterus annectens TaxID=7888 RepID=UPI001CF93A90|nr:histamine H3 receptor-like [Protopterus annectens]